MILSGGPHSVFAENSPVPDRGILSLSVPILGICYGFQWLCQQSGGSVVASDKREYGHTRVTLQPDCPLFAGIRDREISVWMSHGDRTDKIPAGYQIGASTGSTPFAAVWNDSLKRYGVQFHPEVAHTEHGTRMLQNFLLTIAGLTPDWTMGSYLHEEVARIRTLVGHRHVLCGLSGGVDSSVVAAMLQRAIPGQVTCVLVDHGLMRAGEADRVREIFEGHFGVNLIVVDAADRFLDALVDVQDPEKKREIIKKLFVEAFLAEAAKIDNVAFLAQGTLYPDVIESSKHHGVSATIKSHHNVGIEKLLGLELVEPLRHLFKDEVRDLGRELGLPEDLVGRHPFPGPGLGIRVLGQLTRERVATLRRADQIMVEEIRQAGWYDKIWQALCVLLPVRSVGVMGDHRTYEEVVAVRCVNSVDGMTADWTELPRDLLRAISNRIINEVAGVNRVVYDISSKPPATIEWE